jgi:hypothetical protein
MVRAWCVALWKEQRSQSCSHDAASIGRRSSGRAEMRRYSARDRGCIIYVGLPCRRRSTDCPASEMTHSRAGRVIPKKFGARFAGKPSESGLRHLSQSVFAIHGTLRQVGRTAVNNYGFVAAPFLAIDGANRGREFSGACPCLDHAVIPAPSCATHPAALSIYCYNPPEFIGNGW